jgi:hypothetical protein
MPNLNDERLPLPLGTDPQSVRQRVEAMEKVLERLFVIPGTKQQVGLDVVLDLVPVVGDIAAAVMGAYIVWEAKNLGMSKFSKFCQEAAQKGLIQATSSWPFARAGICSPPDWNGSSSTMIPCSAK